MTAAETPAIQSENELKTVVRLLASEHSTGGALARERFTTEAERLLTVMDRRLAEAPFLAGDDYSIADIAAYPWALMATTLLRDVLAGGLANMPAVHRWLETVGQRPAVLRGMNIPGALHAEVALDGVR